MLLSTLVLPTYLVLMIPTLVLNTSLEHFKAHSQTNLSQQHQSERLEELSMHYKFIPPKHNSDGKMQLKVKDLGGGGAEVLISLSFTIKMSCRIRKKPTKTALSAVGL